MTYRKRLEEMGMAWPSLERPDFPFAPAVRVGDIVYVSGQIPEIGSDIAASVRSARRSIWRAPGKPPPFAVPTSSIGWTRNSTAISIGSSGLPS